MLTKKLCILGSTGSIGTQALRVCKNLGIKVTALSAYHNIQLIEQQIREFNPYICHIYNEEKGKELAIRVADTNTKVIYGSETFSSFVEESYADTILTAVVGSIGLLPTITAIKMGMKIALANKETLVIAGKIITQLANKHNVDILPVDSEHSAIFQCLQGNNQKEVKNIILTASGGPFFGKTMDELKSVTLKQALNHPNWSMGAKITIDSATLMNKGFEVIEAKWLFNTTNIKVVVHRESIIHSMVEYNDNSIIAQMGVPSMVLPIQYAFTYPNRVECEVEAFDFSKTLSFQKPDLDTFGLLKLAYDSMEKGGTMPIVLNAANEIAVESFLKEKIKFCEIYEIVSKVVSNHRFKENFSLEECLWLDNETRNKTLDEVTK